MSTQRQHKTKARRDRRRVRLKLKVKSTVKCSKCGAEKMPHTVCKKCGHYKGREVVNTLKKKTKKK